MHDEGTKAVIDLLDDKKMYVVKEGRLIEHTLPDYGEVTVVLLGGKVDRLVDKSSRKV
ncbi:hypothetical protein J14TS2_16310 [Bacillus sp. J14TS2]|uniref:DUF3954 domain-containing protein n=1 Tax=Bacillus sp. J14TS2 TaxID=2807188 RepID=UPI001B05A14B|nr:DUF3954 domain-containing protein [Bacillus sp. J14TS2]GIN71156.1 hypothetical protein J14TS2_16310 [Bacillus sp. J14TS2]